MRRWTRRTSRPSARGLAGRHDAGPYLRHIKNFRTFNRYTMEIAWVASSQARTARLNAPACSHDRAWVPAGRRHLRSLPPRRLRPQTPIAHAIGIAEDTASAFQQGQTLSGWKCRSASSLDTQRQQRSFAKNWTGVLKTKFAVLKTEIWWKHQNAVLRTKFAVLRTIQKLLSWFLRELAAFYAAHFPQIFNTANSTPLGKPHQNWIPS